MNRVFVVMLVLLFAVNIVSAAGSTVLLPMPDGKHGSFDDIKQEIAELLRQDNQQTIDSKGVKAQGYIVKKIGFSGDFPEKFTEGMEKIAKRWLGRQVDDMARQEIARHVAEYLRASDLPLAQVVSAKNKSRDSELEYVVYAGRYDKVEYSNNSMVSDAVMAKSLSALRSGDYVYGSVLEQTLLLINDLPLVAARAKLTPGGKIGTTKLNVVLASDGEKKWRAFVAGDNFGNPATGQYEFSLGVTVNNVSGYADALNAVVMKTNADLYNVVGVYNLPRIFSAYDGFDVAAAWCNYSLGGDFAALQYRGSSAILSAGYNVNIAKSRVGESDLYFRGEWKDISNQMLVVSPTQTTAQNTVEGIIGYKGFFFDGNMSATNNYDVSLSYGHLWQNGNSSEVVYDSTTVNKTGNYAVLDGRFGRMQSLGENWRYNLNFSGQLASCNLNSTEKFTLGGFGGIKAFAQGAGAGDQGGMGQLLVSCVLPTGEKINKYCDLSAGIFADGGTVMINRNLWQGYSGPNYQGMADAGIEIRAGKQDYYSVVMDAARKIWYWTNNGSADQDAALGRILVKATVFF